jgi:hypothetical protein
MVLGIINMGIQRLAMTSSWMTTMTICGEQGTEVLRLLLLFVLLQRTNTPLLLSTLILLRLVY